MAALGNILLTCVPTPAGVVTTKYRDGDDSAATPPSTPELGQPNALNSTTVDIPLLTASTGGTEPRVYELERSATSAVAGFAVVDANADFSGDGVYTQTGLTASTQYWWRLACVDAIGRRSGYSGVFTTTTPAAGGGDVTAPTVPTNLVATSTVAGQAALTWTNGTDAVGIAFTDVTRGNSVAGVPTNAGVVIDTVTGSGSTYTDYGAPSGSQVFYKIRHRDAAGNASADTSNVYVTIASTPSGGTTLLADDFSSSTWYRSWHVPVSSTVPVPVPYDSSPARVTRVLPTYTGEGYAPRSGGTGYAIKVVIEANTNYGTGFSFYPRISAYGQDPTEMNLEFYIRFGSTWAPTTNGKLPGISGDYNDGGFGNDPSDGTNGWSARNTFFNPCSNGEVPFGTYVYHADQPANDGEGFAWDGMRCGGVATFEKNRWYKVRQYVRRNTNNAHDGWIQGWIDGVQRADRRTYQFTNKSAYKIDRAWMNVYHGGGALAVPGQNCHLFITDVRIWVP